MRTEEEIQYRIGYLKKRLERDALNNPFRWEITKRLIQEDEWVLNDKEEK